MADSDPFATADNTKQAQAEYLYHQELRRRAQDTIRVQNPTDQDYFVEWDHFNHKIPANSTADHPRYIATKYVREMTVKLINELADKEGQELLKRAGKEKPEILLDKYLENKAVWDKVPRTDNPELMAKYFDLLWVGLVHEYGRDMPDDMNDATNTDFRTTEEKLMDNLKNRRVDDSPVAAVEPTTTRVGGTIGVSTKQELANEVSQ